MSDSIREAEREAFQIMRDRAIEDKRALEAALRIQATRYVGSEFVADARHIARLIIARNKNSRPP